MKQNSVVAEIPIVDYNAQHHSSLALKLKNLYTVLINV